MNSPADAGSLQSIVVAQIVVRYRDLDTLGHVNNAVYATYLETGRVVFLQAVATEVGRSTSAHEFAVNVPFVVAELTIVFKSPAFLGETLDVGVWMASAGRSSFVFEYVVSEHETGRLVATGRSVQVMIDRLTGEKVAVPQEFLDAAASVQNAPVARH